MFAIAAIGAEEGVSDQAGLRQSALDRRIEAAHSPRP
jgi:hypothetical protein